MRALTRASLRISTAPSPFSRAKIVIGTPQARWREMTQSDRLSTMPVLRFSPAAGTQRVTAMAASARLRSASREATPEYSDHLKSSRVMGLSAALNQSGVFRRDRGFLEGTGCRVGGL